MSLPPVTGNSNLESQEAVLADVVGPICNEVRQVKEVDKKTFRLNEAYAHFISTKEGWNESKHSLFQILELYASQICYACPGPKDEDLEGTLGFKEVGALIEYMIYLEYLASNPQKDSGEYKTIIDLIAGERKWSKDQVRSDVRKFLSTSDPSVIFQNRNWSKEQKTVMLDAMIRLSFAHQNNPLIKGKENLELHQKFYDMICSLLIEERDYEKLFTFCYNKDRYLYALEAPDDKEGQVKVYDDLLERFKEYVDVTGDFYLSKVAQCKNMQAILLSDRTNRVFPDSAIQLWREALDIRENKLTPPTGDSQKIFDYGILLANEQSTLAIVLMFSTAQMKDSEAITTRLKEAKELINQAVSFANQQKALGKNHQIFKGYFKNQVAIDAALSKMNGES